MKCIVRFGFAFVIVVSGWGLIAAQETTKEQPPAAPEKQATLGPLEDGSITIGPNYKNAPETKAREGVPKGKVKELNISMKESKYYPSSGGGGKKGGGTNENRKVSVYVPSQYVPGTPLPFSVIQDASYIQVLPTILDNMINDKRLPIMGAIFVANGGGSRSLEYDTVSGKYAEFIENEVLPVVEKECNVTLTKDPNARASMGGSSGGIAAFTMAWFHPEWYHLVLSYSGSFTNLRKGPGAPNGGWDYHSGIIAKAEKKPIRAWLHVAENDLNSNSDLAKMNNWPTANKRMAEVLKEKGYHYRLTYSLNSKHVDGKVTNQTLPEALTWLWQDYVAEKK